MDFQNLISNILAAKAPVHAPVPGRGMPTKIAKPIASYRSIALPLRLVRVKSQFVKRLPRGNLLILSKNQSMNSRIRGIGSILPIRERIRASCQDILKSRMATGIDPLSSIRGSMDMIRIIKTGLKPFSESHCTVVSENPDAKTVLTESVSSSANIIDFKLFSFTGNSILPAKDFTGEMFAVVCILSMRIMKMLNSS